MLRDATLRTRRFSMLEVAELMQLKNKAPKERRRHVKRILRRLERRDGVQYLHADTPGGKLYTTLAAIDQLRAHDPGSIGRMRVDIDGLGTEMKRVRKRLSKAEKDIENLGGLQLESVTLLNKAIQGWGQKGAQRGHSRQE